jgi:acetate kinase
VPMRALVIKCTPEKIRYDLFSFGDQIASLMDGRIGDIGAENPQHTYHYGSRGRAEGSTLAADHAEAFERVAAVMRSPTTGHEDFTQNLTVVAHRVPHGGERFKGPEVISDSVLREIEALSPCSPRGNPASVLGIRATANLFTGVPQVAVFESAFSQSLPQDAFIYPVPRDLYEKHGLRRYGFHGIAHRHAIGTAAVEMGRFPEELRVVSVYLGEESSAVAFGGGRCVDVTTGLSAPSGLPGATSAGTIDPAALTFLMRATQSGPEQIDYLLTRQSGMLGLSGTSSSFLEILDRASEGDARCEQAVKVYVLHVIRAIGSLVAVMGGVDLLVFTGSAVESSARVRGNICERLGFLGIALDSFRNDGSDGRTVAAISRDDSKVKVYLVPGDEERIIARESVTLVTGRDAGGAGPAASS